MRVDAFAHDSRSLPLNTRGHRVLLCVADHASGLFWHFLCLTRSPITAPRGRHYDPISQMWNHSIKIGNMPQITVKKGNNQSRPLSVPTGSRASTSPWVNGHSLLRGSPSLLILYLAVRAQI